MFGREALVPACGGKALGGLHEPARALGKLVEIHVSSLVGHPLTRAERGRTLITSGEARSRMPGRLATVPYIGVRQRRGKGVAASHPSRAGRSRPGMTSVGAPKENYGIRRDEAGFPQD